jgi:DNA-binding response OmpR family regulator/anti-sigma regulatory factor (Ser/Thr protein kinase)
MTFQKAEQGMLRLKVMPLSMASFLKVILDNFQSLAERNKVTLMFDNAIGEAVASFDPDKMEMVLNNLISNALKFTDEGGEVRLALSEEVREEGESFLVITVDDNGKGIAAEELPRIFDRYYSEHNKKGTGLGLALTRTLVELHNGTIEVSSVPGKYTSCKVYLPHDQINVAGLSEKAFVPDCNPFDEKDLSCTEKEASGTGRRHKILIVDDNREILDYLQLLFEVHYEIIGAINGRDALEKLAVEEPDLIISDLMMPEVDGREFCRRVKSSLNTSHIPFILLTAKTSDEDRLEGFQTGADAYISKPFHPEILKVRAEKMIEYHQLLKEKYKGDGVVIPRDIAKNPLDEKFIQKVLDTIQSNMSNDEFSVEDLGEAVFMSRSNLFRKLKAITGQTPIELIYQVRIKRSMDLLLERKLSISEIAYEVGFKNPSSFTSSFKKQYGKSPSEYLNDILKAHSAN